MLGRIFWTLFWIETAGYGFLMLHTVFGKGRWGPEGPVGAWLIFAVPPFLVGIPLAVFLLGNSDHARQYAVFALAFPLIMLVLGPVLEKFDHWKTERHLAGDLSFLVPSQRKLAHAISAHDVAAVKSLIPGAGDLNKRHRDDTIFRFALANSDKSEASLEIIKAMLDAGANPKVETAAGNWPLALAMSSSPAMTKLLLEYGADPNSLDGDRPIWWWPLYRSDDESMETLRILLAHGADVRRRDTNNSPAGWAAYHKNWRAMWLLMEHGAEWKNEKAFDQPIAKLLEDDLRYRLRYQEAIPEEMLKIQAKYEEEGGRQ